MHRGCVLRAAALAMISGVIVPGVRALRADYDTHQPIDTYVTNLLSGDEAKTVTGPTLQLVPTKPPLAKRSHPGHKLSLHKKAKGAHQHDSVDVKRRHSGFMHNGKRSSLLDEQNLERQKARARNRLIVERMSVEDAAKVGSVNYALIVPVMLCCILLTTCLMKFAIIFY
eukprot:gnl/TRDRNA2_/TRDRNA2_180632_c0_seq1.p1 gnl/TRDRNA2_/TRDRNA2_180632_c0~~gnl/TRDRNA2_/TRDRNA2_180632_c0_seq1.p1  ORF type:complete len:170 (-),score=19.22 gnl/TRDRNA2_/TRDRNA2_180632_c0_seq1:76-585(-)